MAHRYPSTMACRNASAEPMDGQPHSTRSEMGGCATRKGIMPDIRISISKDLHTTMKKAAIDDGLTLADLVRKTLALKFLRDKVSL